MCFFPAVEGVCDTPLHLFGYFMGDMVVVSCAFSLPWRAYAIRPYRFTVDSMMSGWLFGLFRGGLHFVTTGVGLAVGETWA